MKSFPPNYNPSFELRRASRCGHLVLTRLLLGNSQVDPAAEDNDAIRVASKHGHAKVVQLLLNDSRVDPAANRNQAIRGASQYGHSEVVRLLLGDARVDPAALNNQAIKLVCADSGDLETARLLLNDSRVDPSSDLNAPFRFASKLGYFDIVHLLLGDVRVDPAAGNNEAIWGASLMGHTDVVALLANDPRTDLRKAVDIKNMWFIPRVKKWLKQTQSLPKAAAGFASLLFAVEAVALIPPSKTHNPFYLRQNKLTFTGGSMFREILQELYPI